MSNKPKLEVGIQWLIVAACVVICLVFITGCEPSAEEKAEQIAEMVRTCPGEVNVTIYINTWFTESMTIECQLPEDSYGTEDREEFIGD